MRSDDCGDSKMRQLMLHGATNVVAGVVRCGQVTVEAPGDFRSNQMVVEPSDREDLWTVVMCRNNEREDLREEKISRMECL